MSDILRGNMAIETVAQPWKNEQFSAMSTSPSLSPSSRTDPPKARAILSWRDDSKRNQEYILREGESVLLGRGPKNDVVILDRKVSRHHARIKWQESAFEVSDLGSQNGTFVNDERVESPRLLVDGDLIRMFDVEFAFKTLRGGAIRKYTNIYSENQTMQLDRFSVITSGSLPPNPAEVLGSAKMAQVLMELKERTEMVILDGPPFLLADASVLSARVDGVLPVIRTNRTQANSALAMLEQLNRAEARVIGIVLNRVRRQAPGYYYKSLSEYTSFSYDYPKDTLPMKESAQ
jgi:hypothetical protein